LLVELYEPESYKIADPVEKFKICNGCGAANSKFDFVPDSIYLLNINRACNVHDWMYHHGRTKKDKQEADRVFLNNLLTLIEAEASIVGRLLKPFRRRRALKYYEAVVGLGGPAFWANKI